MSVYFFQLLELFLKIKELIRVVVRDNDLIFVECVRSCCNCLMEFYGNNDIVSDK